MANILVIDDEKNICALYAMELKKEGYNVFTATSADDGFKILDTEPIDLVILDLRMPSMHGIEALEKMMVKQRNLAVLINTAYSEYRDDFLTWLAEDYIIKSPDLKPLKEKVKQVLAKKNRI